MDSSQDSQAGQLGPAFRLVGLLCPLPPRSCPPTSRGGSSAFRTWSSSLQACGVWARVTFRSNWRQHPRVRPPRTIPCGFAWNLRRKLPASPSWTSPCRTGMASCRLSRRFLQRPPPPWSFPASCWRRNQSWSTPRLQRGLKAPLSCRYPELGCGSLRRISPGSCRARRACAARFVMPMGSGPSTWWPTLRVQANHWPSAPSVTVRRTVGITAPNTALTAAPTERSVVPAGGGSARPVSIICHVGPAEVRSVRLAPSRPVVAASTARAFRTGRSAASAMAHTAPPVVEACAPSARPGCACAAPEFARPVGRPCEIDC